MQWILPMLDYEVSRSINIEKPLSEVVSFISDFENWPSWSPWLIIEPECQLSYHGDQGSIGAGYEWNGQLVGAGSMTLTEKSPLRLDMALSFLKPFKSTAEVSFTFKDLGPSTEVTWVMNSKLPWYLFFLKKMMKAFIGLDYEKGLTMLKSKLETGDVISKPSVLGERHQDTIRYIALRGSATIPELGSVMNEHHNRLKAFIEDNTIQVAGPSFGLFEKMDMATTQSDFYTCYPVSESVTVGGDFIFNTLPQCETYVIQHLGEYQYMGNAWSLAMSSSRANKIKIKRKPLGMEIYIDDPNEIDAENLRTEIVLFKK